LNDVATLKATLRTFRALAGEKPIITVMDKGFFSLKNINMMLDKQQQIDFIIAVPFTCNFAKEAVENERKDIDTLCKTIVNGKESFRAVIKERKWNNGHKVYTHVYYNARKAQGIREDLYIRVAALREKAMEHPEKCLDSSDHKKYLIIEKAEGVYKVKVCEDAVDAELQAAGWMVVISNCIKDAKEAIKIYREKDVVEKGFLRLKTSLDVRRIRVHSENSMQNKVFIGFISLILLSAIHNVMIEKRLYSKMTMKKLIFALSKLKLQMVKGVRVLFPVTKEQRSIYEAFGVQEPV
jgi:transposase